MLAIIEVLLLAYACTLNSPPPRPQADDGVCTIVQTDCGQGG